MNESDIVEGYMDGLRSELENLPQGNNRSDSYRHGWNNGRDDRLRRPRATAADLREAAADIERREASYL